MQVESSCFEIDRYNARDLKLKNLKTSVHVVRGGLGRPGGIASDVTKPSTSRSRTPSLQI